MDIFTLNAAKAYARQKIKEAGGMTSEGVADLVKENVGTEINAYLPKNDMAKYAMNYYDATKYGVIVDNEDNSEALQVLMKSIYETGGGTVYIPNGEYHFKSTIRMIPNVSVLGENTFMTKLIMDDNGESWPLFNRLMGEKFPLYNACFSNFTVDGSALTVGDVKAKAFYAQYIKNCIFRDLYLYGTPATAMGIDMISNVLIHNVICENCGHMYENIKIGSSGIGIGCGGYEDENFTISNCICINSGQYGIFVEEQKPQGWGGKYDTTKGCNIINNIVRNGINNGIGVRGMTGVNISGNTVYNNAKNGIMIDGGYNISLTNNIIFDNTESSVCVAPKTCDISDIVISGNNITGNKIGIEVKNESEDLNVSGITIIGNSMRNNVQDLHLQNTITDICINGNALFGESKNMAILEGTKLLDSTAPVNTLQLEDEKCKYCLDAVSKYTYKMILKINDTYYLYASNSPIYICADGDNYHEVCMKYKAKRCITTESLNGELSDAPVYTIINETLQYGYGYGNRQLSQFVWSNHDLYEYGTDTVLVTAGSHE